MEVRIIKYKYSLFTTYILKIGHDSDAKQISEEYMDALEKLFSKPGEVLNDMLPFTGKY